MAVRFSGPPNSFHMLHSTLHLFDGKAGAKLEYFDVLGLYQWLKRVEINVARTGSAVVPARKLHVVNVKAVKPLSLGFQMHGMMDKSEVLLDLGMARIMPIDQAGAGNFSK